jgi:hypothetical protein
LSFFVVPRKTRCLQPFTTTSRQTLRPREQSNLPRLGGCCAFFSSSHPQYFGNCIFMLAQLSKCTAAAAVVAWFLGITAANIFATDL